MRCFTFESLKSLKAPGLDGFDFGLLNLQCRERGRKGDGVTDLSLLFNLSLAKEIFSCNLLKRLFIPELLPSASYLSFDAKTRSSQAGALSGPFSINNSPIRLPEPGHYLRVR